jgi:type IV secretion system protein VirD4
MEILNNIKIAVTKKMFKKNEKIANNRKLSWIGKILTAAAVFLHNRRFLTRNQKIIILLTAIGLICAALSMVLALVNLKNFWPAYLIAGYLICLLIGNHGRKDKLTGVLFLAIFTLSAAVWPTCLIIDMTPAGQKLQALQNWPAGKNLWYMLTGTGYNAGIVNQAKTVWSYHQIWYIPLLYLISRAIAISTIKQKINPLHGTAHFAEPGEAGLVKEKEGFLLGKEKDGNRDVVLPMKEVYEHIIMVGAPGAGKTAGVFTPNLLRMAENGGYANLVITDPKAELLSICGPELEKAGYEVVIYHPYSPELTNAWNMLYYADGYDAADDMIQTIIHNVIQGKGNQHWDNQANILLGLASYHLRLKLGEKATMSHLQAMATAKPKDIEVTLRNSENDKIRINAQGFFSQMERNDTLITSVMNNVPKLLKLWSMDRIRATTSVNEINFSDLCSDKKIALFVITPLDKKEQLRPLFATFFSQMFKIIQEKGREMGKLPRPLMIFLEEAANVGAIPNFDSFLTVVRGYKVSIFVAIQEMAQLVNIYGPEKARTIIGACSTYIVSPRISAEDAKYFSDMIGNTTIETIEKKFNRHMLIRKAGHSESEKTIKRQLLTPDEIRAMDKDKDLLVIAGNRRPVHIRPALYYKDDRWARLGKKCNDVKELEKRRNTFLRRNRHLDTLEIPREEKMMQEAIMTTATMVPKTEKPENKDREYKPRPVTINTAENTTQPAPEETPDTQPAAPPKKNKVTLDLNSVKVIKKGNPFDKNKSGGD